MFNNKLHLGTVFGLIFSAPTVFALILIILELEYSDFSEIGIVAFLGVLILFTICTVGFFMKKPWALKLASFILIIVSVIAVIGILSEDVETNEFIDTIGIILIVSVFTFGAVVLLNNDIVLEQFGAKETYDDLDEILDADEY